MLEVLLEVRVDTQFLGLLHGTAASRHGPTEVFESCVRWRARWHARWHARWLGSEACEPLDKRIKKTQNALSRETQR